ncbi:MAG: hypothetical protein PUD07_02255 [bacterium]|nr:hypothetical protein [bacterium]
MNSEIIKIGDLLTLKINATKKTFDDIKKRFPNTNHFDIEYDYELCYKEIENIKKIELGEIFYPFRNATYIVNNFNKQVISYSPKQQYSCENIIIRNDKRISIFCKNDNNSKVLIRVITELLVRKLLERNFFPIHASCIMVNDKATLFLGKKDSGKSTALFCNVLLNNAYPISNDITFVGKEEGIWKAFGLPYDFTFDESLFFQTKYIMKEFIKLNKKNLYGSNKIRFDIAEFNKIFNTNLIWEAPISMISIVELDKEHEFTVSPPIKPKDAILNLQEKGKDKNFTFDDFMMINKLFPNFNYEQLSEEIPFNQLKGNILKYYLRR